MSLDAGASDVTPTPDVQAKDYLVTKSQVVGPAGGWVSDAGTYFAFASREIPEAVTGKPAYAQDGNYYGLGWRVWPLADGDTLTHFGSMPGAFSLVVRRADGFVVVALFNGRPAEDDAAFKLLFDGVMALPAY